MIDINKIQFFQYGNIVYFTNCVNVLLITIMSLCRLTEVVTILEFWCTTR